MARNANVPFKGRIQKRKTYHLQIITFGLQRAAGPYSRVKLGFPAIFAIRPLFLRKQTLVPDLAMSRKCHKRP